jgi:hypothetical protein
MMFSIHPLRSASLNILVFSFCTPRICAVDHYYFERKCSRSVVWLHRSRECIYRGPPKRLQIWRAAAYPLNYGKVPFHLEGGYAIVPGI